MAASTASTAFDRGLLLDNAEAVLGFRPEPALQERIEELAGRATEGELDADELAEYEGYVRANKFIAILRRQAGRPLAGRPFAFST